MSRKEKIVIISPHLDDEVLGVGGTIAKLVDKKFEVNVIFVAYRKYGNKINKKLIKEDIKKAKNAQSVLGYKNSFFLSLEDESLHNNFNLLLSKLEKLIYKIKPKDIYCCFNQDNNQDHRTVYDVARIIFRWTSGIRNVYLYETPSSTEMSPSFQRKNFTPNLYVDISKYINKKIKAMKCYDNELKNFPNARSIEGIKTYAKYRGMESGLKNAEAFMIVRKILD